MFRLQHLYYLMFAPTYAAFLSLEQNAEIIFEIDDNHFQTALATRT